MPAAALTGLSFFLFGIGGSLPLLIVAAAINGLGIGFASGSMTTSTFDIAPEGQLARFQSLRRFSAELGTLTGPPLAGSVASFLSPKDVFLFFTPPYIVSAALLAFGAKETHPGRRAELQLVPQLSLADPCEPPAVGMLCLLDGPRANFDWTAVTRLLYRLSRLQDFCNRYFHLNPAISVLEEYGREQTRTYLSRRQRDGAFDAQLRLVERRLWARRSRGPRRCE